MLGSDIVGVVCSRVVSLGVEVIYIRSGMICLLRSGMLRSGTLGSGTFESVMLGSGIRHPGCN